MAYNRMADENRHNSGKGTDSGAPQEGWTGLPFDTTTNFSLLGLYLGRLKGKDNTRKKIDLVLDE
jgi:hypothetical protein